MRFNHDQTQQIIRRQESIHSSSSSTASTNSTSSSISSSSSLLSGLNHHHHQYSGRMSKWKLLWFTFLTLSSSRYHQIYLSLKLKLYFFDYFFSDTILFSVVVNNVVVIEEACWNFFRFFEIWKWIMWEEGEKKL